MFNRLVGWLQIFFADAANSKSSDERLHTRYLMQLTWLLAATNLAAIVLTFTISSFRASVVTLAAGTVVHVIAALLMGSSYYRVGRWLGIVSVTGVMIGSVLSNLVPQQLIVTIFPLLYVSLYMRPRLTMLILLITVGTLVGVFPFIRGSLGDILLSSGLVIAAGIIILFQTILMYRARHDLKESENRYHSAIEGSLDAFYLVHCLRNPDGSIADFVITDTNTRGEEVFGQPRQSFLGRSINKEFPHLLTEFSSARAEAILNAHQSSTEDFMGSNGVSFSVQAVPFSDYLALTFKDTTESKLADQVRREVERLNIELDKEREMNLLRANLMSTISHEFRTPLTVIMNNNEILDRYYQRLTDKQREERITAIKDHVLQLRTMLENISLVIRGASNRLQFNPEQADLGLYLHTLFKQIHEMNHDEHVMTYTTAGDVSDTLVDLTLVHQIVSNLLLNALKFTPSGGTVTLHVQGDATTVTLTVSDSGIGIPETDLARIYEPFHRGQNIGEVRGTGLGLSIVRECTIRHNGTIKVSSIVGQGTTFIICLPRRSAVALLPE